MNSKYDSLKKLQNIGVKEKLLKTTIRKDIYKGISVYTERKRNKKRSRCRLGAKVIKVDGLQFIVVKYLV